MSINHSARTKGIIGISFLSFSNMKVCCVFSLESPHRGDSNEYTQHTIININKRAMMALNRSPEFKSSNPKPRAAELLGT